MTRRRVHVLAANWMALVVGRGVQGWWRNPISVAPALGSMVILLTAAGAAAVAAVALATTFAAQSAQAYVLHVYIADQATVDQVSQLAATLNADPRVRSVTYVSRDQELRLQIRRPGVRSLVDAAGGNPFPASLQVTLWSNESIGPVAKAVTSDPAVDPLYPTSYDADAYARLRRIALLVAEVGAGLLGILAMVAVMVTANAVRAAVVARREEVRLMRLVGAPWWAVRLPFLVEGGLTGSAAGVLAGVLVVGGALAALQAETAMFIDFLPGVTPVRLAALAGGLVMAGMLLGGAAGALALRRLPR